MVSVKLIYNSVSYSVFCTQVTSDYRRAVNAKPNANPTDIVEAQTQGFENPVYVLQGVHFSGKSRIGESVLTQSVLLSMLKENNVGDGSLKLEVSYGSSDYLYGFDGSSTQIPVVMKAFNYPLNTKDSSDAYLPVGSITLVETK